jgi:hypothetical protein
MNAPASITRKNLVTFYCQFYQPPPPVFPDSPPPLSPPAPPTIVNPTSATVVLKFKGLNEQLQQQTIAMALDSTSNTWSASWDTSNCIGSPFGDSSPDSRVDWVVYGAGIAQAAQQGTFYVVANYANTV